MNDNIKRFPLSDDSMQKITECLTRVLEQGVLAPTDIDVGLELELVEVPEGTAIFCLSRHGKVKSLKLFKYIMDSVIKHAESEQGRIQ